jgi:hypothetical protein
MCGLPERRTPVPIVMRPAPCRYGISSIQNPLPTLAHWLRNSGSFQKNRRPQISPSRAATCTP